MFSNKSTVFYLLVVIIMLQDVQSGLPTGCNCYNGTDGIFPRKCSSPGCSRGDNDDCNSFSVYWGSNYRIRYGSGTYDVHGCNCPGFSYNAGSSTGKNAVSTATSDTAISTYHRYTSCSMFDTSPTAVACCNYCCASS